jgi:hypothetical protein
LPGWSFLNPRLFLAIMRRCAGHRTVSITCVRWGEWDSVLTHA